MRSYNVCLGIMNLSRLKQTNKQTNSIESHMYSVFFHLFSHSNISLIECSFFMELSLCELA